MNSSLSKTITYARNKNWLENSQCTKKKSLDKLDSTTKLNNIVADRQDRYQSRLNFKQSLDKLDSTTKLNNIVADRQDRYQSRLNFKQSLDKLSTIEENKVLEIEDNVSIKENEDPLKIEIEDPSSIKENEDKKNIESSANWCIIS